MILILGFWSGYFVYDSGSSGSDSDSSCFIYTGSASGFCLCGSGSAIGPGCVWSVSGLALVLMSRSVCSLGLVIVRFALLFLVLLRFYCLLFSASVSPVSGAASEFLSACFLWYSRQNLILSLALFISGLLRDYRDTSRLDRIYRAGLGRETLSLRTRLRAVPPLNVNVPREWTEGCESAMFANLPMNTQIIILFIQYRFDLMITPW